jgi:hypothetical protein
MLHGSLFVAFATVGSALLVWPQWTASDGVRNALEIQQEREQALTYRLGRLRETNDRLRQMDVDDNRVFRAGQLKGYPALVRTVARRQKAIVARVQVTPRSHPRWRAVTIPAELWNGGPAEADYVEPVRSVREERAGIRPRSVQVVLKGTWPNVYRTIASLSQQDRLFIPDRWELAPYKTKQLPNGVRAEVWATVFEVKVPEERPRGAKGPLAAALPVEGEG